MRKFDSDKLFIAETALITLPFSLISSLGYVFGLYIWIFFAGIVSVDLGDGLSAIAIWLFIIVATIFCLLANYSILFLSWKLIFRDVEGLNSSKKYNWIFAATGAVISVIAICNWLLIKLNFIDSNPGVIFLFGAPLLIPYVHLKWVLKKPHEIQTVPT